MLPPSSHTDNLHPSSHIRSVSACREALLGFPNTTVTVQSFCQNRHTPTICVFHKLTTGLGSCIASLLWQLSTHVATATGDCAGTVIGITDSNSFHTLFQFQLSPPCFQSQSMYVPVEQLLPLHYRQLAREANTCTKPGLSISTKC